MLTANLSFYGTYKQNSNGYPMFSGSWNSRILLRIVSDVTGSRFLKMAASIPEVVISPLPYWIATRSNG